MKQVNISILSIFKDKVTKHNISELIKVSKGSQVQVTIYNNLGITVNGSVILNKTQQISLNPKDQISLSFNILKTTSLNVILEGSSFQDKPITYDPSKDLTHNTSGTSKALVPANTITTTSNYEGTWLYAPNNLLQSYYSVISIPIIVKQVSKKLRRPGEKSERI